MVFGVLSGYSRRVIVVAKNKMMGNVSQYLLYAAILDFFAYRVRLALPRHIYVFKLKWTIDKKLSVNNCESAN